MGGATHGIVCFVLFVVRSVRNCEQARVITAGEEEEEEATSNRRVAAFFLLMRRREGEGMRTLISNVFF